MRLEEYPSFQFVCGDQSYGHYSRFVDYYLHVNKCTWLVAISHSTSEATNSLAHTNSLLAYDVSSVRAVVGSRGFSSFG